MNLLKSIVNTYPYHEQQEIMHYMRTNGVYKPYRSIEKLCEDLYKATYKASSNPSERPFERTKKVF